MMKHALLGLSAMALAMPLAAQDASDFPVTRADPPPPVVVPPPVNANTAPVTISRLVPPPPPAGAIRPPSPMSAPRTGPEKVPDATPDDLLANVNTCMAAVSPDLDLNISALLDDNWGWGTPESQEVNGRKIETANYYKNNRVITLVQTGNYLSCRITTSVHREPQAAVNWDALRASVGAVSAFELAATNPLRANLRGRLSDELLKKVLVTEGYMITLDTSAVGPNSLGFATQPAEFTRVLVTLAPIAPRYRLSAQTQISEEGSE